MVRRVGAATVIAGLVVAVWAAMAFAAAGDLDTTFSGDGKLTTAFRSSSVSEGYKVAIQADGKLVAAGNSSGSSAPRFALARYNTNGSLDTTFSGDGELTTSLGNYSFASGLAIQSDGKIVAAGSAAVSGFAGRFALVRYNTNGSLDKTFSGDGKVLTKVGTDAGAYDVAIQPDGKILAVGNALKGFALARYNPDGTLDSTFSGDGKLITNILGCSCAGATSLALQPDGKIVVAGVAYVAASSRFAVARYNPNGSLDTTFSGDGMLRGPAGGAEGVAVQPDGKIVTAGSDPVGTEFLVTRYNSDGTPDTTFNGNGKVITKIGCCALGFALALQSDGEIVVGGGAGSGFALARYNADGSLDSTFSGDGKLTTRIGSFAEAHGLSIQSDGKIVAVGWADVNRQRRFAVARYLGS